MVESGTAGEERSTGAVAWYAREELPGPWRIAACAEHGRDLERHRFAYAGARVDDAGGGSREAGSCTVCRRPETLAEVARCTCEHDTARCPAHQNIGCGG